MITVDVIAVGDGIVDVLVKLPEDDPNVIIQAEQALITLGAKIPVTQSSFFIGGNATHLAIGMSRMGFTSALAAELGTDEFAEKIIHDLEKEKIIKDLLIQTPGADSTFTVSLSMGNDRTTLVRHVVRKHEFHLEKLAAKWVYLTSMGDQWENAYEKTVAYVKKIGCKLAFNPGSTQLKKGVDSFKYIIEASNLLIVNKEEAEVLLYKQVLPQEKKESCESLLFRLQRMGPQIVVITDGLNGSYALDGQATVATQSIFPVATTEKTGAGDAFAAGFLAGLLQEKSLSDCLLWGTANASGVVTKIGGKEGLLTKEEIEHRIQEYS